MPLYITSSSGSYYTTSSSSSSGASSSVSWSKPVQAMIWENAVANYKDAWIEQQKEMTKLEIKGEGNSKAAQQIRSKMIQYWNKMTPAQQKDIANKYCPDN